MSQNIFYGGDDYDLSTGDFCASVTAARERCIGSRASSRRPAPMWSGCRSRAEHPATGPLLGWYASPRAHVISRFPIVDPPGSGGVYVFVEPTPGRVVAVANMHLPSTPYGPTRCVTARRRHS
jgi:hypothetical protein